MTEAQIREMMFHLFTSSTVLRTVPVSALSSVIDDAVKFAEANGTLRKVKVNRTVSEN